MSPDANDSDQDAEHDGAEESEHEDEMEQAGSKGQGRKQLQPGSIDALPPRTAEQDKVEKEWGFYRSPAESSISTPAASQGQPEREEDDDGDSETEDEREAEQYRVSTLTCG